MAAQTKQQAASDAEAALHRLRRRIHVTDDSGFGELHNMLSDEVLVHVGRIREAEVTERLQAVAHTIFLCQMFDNEALSYGVLCSTADALHALQAVLAGEPIPARTFLSQVELHVLIHEGRFPNLEGYRDWMDANGVIE